MGPLTFACSLWCITHHPNTVGKPLQIIEFKKAYVCVVLHVRAELLELSLYGWRKREKERRNWSTEEGIPSALLFRPVVSVEFATIHYRDDERGAHAPLCLPS